nr:putative reverse transcriptase domain-containing protein [Tanacetum cinerariifolium]
MSPRRTRPVDEVYEQEFEQRIMTRLEKRLNQFADQLAYRLNEVMNAMRRRNDEDPGNLFADDAYSDDEPDPPRQNPREDDRRWESGIRVNIPEFDGNTLNPEGFIDWLVTVEDVFELKEVPEKKRVPLIATKLRGGASGSGNATSRFVPNQTKVVSGNTGPVSKGVGAAEAVQKLELKTEDHPKPYKLQWLRRGDEMTVSKRVHFTFSMGKTYKDNVWCDVVSMDACHLLLGRPWEYDRAITHNGRANTYSFLFEGVKITLMPNKPKEIVSKSTGKEVAEDSEIPKTMIPLLKEFSDVFNVKHLVPYYGDSFDDVLAAKSRSIRGIMIDGVWIEDPHKVKREFYQHFSNTFAKPVNQRALLNMEFPNTITLEHQMDLECDVTKEELKKARVVDAGMFKGVRLNSSLNLSHKFYADDAIFVGQCGKARMSYAQSTFSYLGTKVGCSMSRTHAWEEVIDKVSSRLSRWKMKTLSIRGRLTPLKSVLGSMPIFHMSIFKAPLTVLRKLESIRSHFFNGHDQASRKATWIRWDSVLAPKDKRRAWGLEFIRFKSRFNAQMGLDNLLPKFLFMDESYEGYP